MADDDMGNGHNGDAAGPAALVGPIRNRWWVAEWQLGDPR